MRIEDVNVGDKVIPRPFGDQSLPGYRTLQGWFRSPCRRPIVVMTVDRTDNTVAVGLGVDSGAVWWPIEHCDPAPGVQNGSTDQPHATQLLIQRHEREVAALRQDIASAQRAVEAASRLVQNRDREEQVLRSQIAALEKEVADLKSERDRVGKTSQTGTRFAQLELD